ncbi:Non-structural maintenance of chromosome element 3 [Echria macrotheca]|uniref:Non-structural maintenance of chromosome element 3 n=1 Tax=Echria macrotheca TaxID=438768 RepID=A0AAJ0BHN1_9PEZI|nr:Non-structural maintenance of chromosome element 3 [Echria macrotheca]
MPRPRNTQFIDDDVDNSGLSQPQSPYNDDGDGDQQMGGVGGGETSQLVKKLVRYAMACEFSRTPIRRDGIKEKVLGQHGREFRKVFEGAQTQLREVCGMEMVELPTRDRNLMTTEQKRKAAKSQSQKEATSNAYMLVSILPSKFKNPHIMTPSKAHSADGEAAYMALYTMIISIITLSGGELSDPRLRRHLARLNAAENMPSANPSDPNHPSEKTELVLQRMIKQGYIVKKTDSGPQGDEEEGTTWHVGPRGKMEVDAESIAGFVRTVYGGSNDELEKKLSTSLGVRERKPAPQGVPEEPDEQAANGGPGPSSRRRSRAVAQDEDEDEDDE